MKVTRSGECKNSPKNAFVEDFLVDWLASDNLSGRMEAGASLPKVPDDLTEVEISHAISHGKIGEANGLITVNGSKKPFAVFIEFASTKGNVARNLTFYSTAGSVK
ncbi:hypothetical protein ASG47_20085 [Devosia sp. Leaf420]|uniref:hypothetical protein n=1 Tax=Devosia sp. Leaf420 TaxID=1736374 RepID=UPI00071237B1|nr:hypothetical protein [Devosia sp. Leaf420]KQT50170.1 hypothetical protein ASG47_20085 [Devosia sp. Leaf420]